MSKKTVIYILTILIATILIYRTNKQFFKDSFNFKPTIKVKIINFVPGSSEHNIMWISKLLREKYKIKAVNEQPDLIVSMVYGDIDIEQVDPAHQAIRIFITPEALTPDLSKYDLALGFDYIDDERYLRMPYRYVNDQLSTKFKRGKCNPNKANFACFLVSNPGGFKLHNPLDLDGCAARNSLFHNLSKYKPVASGGKYLNNVGHIIPHSETSKWLSTCKFVIAYENQSFPGYITEKPFQAYMNGAIPLYYADQSVLTDINPQSVLFAKDFASEEKFIDYIKQVDNDDELYCKIWHEPMMIDSEKDFTVIYDKLRVKLNKLLDQKFRKSYGN